MSINRITREDIIRLKLKKKKQVRMFLILSIIIVAISVTIGVSAFLIIRKNIKDKPQIGKELEIGIKAEIGIGYVAKEEYNDTDSPEDGTEQSYESEEEMLEAIDFVVPETSLPPVEDIKGNNWYNDSLYKPVEVPAELIYFSDSVFIGDSRTEGLLLYSGLPNLNGFCYKGLSVDKLSSDASIYVEGYENKMTCYDAISTTSYNSYYCMFGVNELGWVSIDAFIDNFSSMIDHIKSVNPDAIIYVESILPVSKKVSDSGDVYNQERINEFNARILEMCQTRKDVIYLDIAAAVVGEDGYLPEEASPDGIHCNADYCKRIIQYIRCNTFIKK